MRPTCRDWPWFGWKSACNDVPRMKQNLEPSRSSNQDAVADDPAWAAAGVVTSDALPRFLYQWPILQQALRCFLMQHQHDPQRIQDCVKSGEWQALHHLAHGLKGGAATVGALSLKTTAEQLEAAALAGDAVRCRNGQHAIAQALQRLGNGVSTLTTDACVPSTQARSQSTPANSS